MEVSLEFLGDVTDKMLEGELADEKLIRFLVSSDLTESNSSWPAVAATATEWCQQFSCAPFRIQFRGHNSLFGAHSRQKGHNVVSQGFQ